MRCLPKDICTKISIGKVYHHMQNIHMKHFHKHQWLMSDYKTLLMLTVNHSTWGQTMPNKAEVYCGTTNFSYAQIFCVLNKVLKNIWSRNVSLLFGEEVLAQCTVSGLRQLPALPLAELNKLKLTINSE